MQTPKEVEISSKIIVGTSEQCEDTTDLEKKIDIPQDYAATTSKPEEDPAKTGWIVVVTLLLMSTFFQSFKPSTPALPAYMQEVHGVDATTVR